jgi:hypothetical protein
MQSLFCSAAVLPRDACGFGNAFDFVRAVEQWLVGASIAGTFQQLL